MMQRLDLPLFVVCLGLALGLGAWLAPATAAAPLSTSHPIVTRIASASPLVDAVLLDLVPAERVVLITEHFRTTHPRAGRYPKAVQTLAGLDGLEAILAARPELLISQDLGDGSRAERLREHGIRVLDLGPPAGAEAWEAALRRLGSALGVEDRANALADAYRQRLDRLDAAVANRERPTAVALNLWGDSIWVAGSGSNGHDILIHGGCRNVAAEAGWVGFRQISAEELRALDPSVIVLPDGQAAQLAHRPGLSGWTPRCIELDPQLHGDAGPGIPVAAEMLAEAVGLWLAQGTKAK